MNEKDRKTLLQVNHKWTIYVWDKTRLDPPIMCKIKEFRGDWNKMHNRFQLIARLLDFTILKRDTTLVGYYYAKRGGDCIFCLPDNLNPLTIYAS